MPVDHVVRAAERRRRSLSVCFDWIADGGKKEEWDRKLLDRAAHAAAVRRRVDGAGAEAVAPLTSPRADLPRRRRWPSLVQLHRTIRQQSLRLGDDRIRLVDPPQPHDVQVRKRDAQ